MQMVRRQFLLLMELQGLDDRLRALETEQRRLPQQLQPYETACTEGRQTLGRLQDDIEHTERQRRGLERELESLQAQLAKTQGRLHEIKTNKEYSAVLSEMAVGKQRITAIEDQVLNLMEHIEQSRRTAQMQERHVQEAMQAFTEHSKHVQQSQQTLTEQLMLEQAKRQQIVVDLDEKLYSLYHRLAAQCGSQAVVHMQNGTCGGCHLKVQPQLVSEIRQQNTLITCPHCQRMLLWPSE
jgi:predicted  nucleic acid-binding Zn-ribbon protein